MDTEKTTEAMEGRETSLTPAQHNKDFTRTQSLSHNRDKGNHSRDFTHKTHTAQDLKNKATDKDTPHKQETPKEQASTRTLKGDRPPINKAKQILFSKGS